jgi:transposase-like protein
VDTYYDTAKRTSEFKARIVATCQQPGALIARISQGHELNANLVHTRISSDRQPPDSQQSDQKAAPSLADRIRIDDIWLITRRVTDHASRRGRAPCTGRRGICLYGYLFANRRANQMKMPCCRLRKRAGWCRSLKRRW